MADKRMFSKKVFYTEEFLALSSSAKALYAYICLESDDDGFCPWAGNVIRSCGASPEDLQQLIDEGFLMRFGKIVVVNHWRIQNSLKADRLRPVAYPDIAENLWISAEGEYLRKEENRSMNLLEYRQKYLRDKSDPLKELRGIGSEFSCFGLDSKERIGEDRIDQESAGEGKRAERSAGAGLTAVERKTLEIIFGPGRLDEAIREIGEVEGSLYGALLEHWKGKRG